MQKMRKMEQVADGDIAQFTAGLRWEQRFGELDFVHGLTTSGDPRGIDLETSRYLIMNHHSRTNSCPNSVFRVLICY